MTEERPTDEAILAYSIQVQDEAVQNTPLVSSALPLSTLAEEYVSPRILTKIKYLKEDGVGWHKTRGDGNCFYRAFAYALLSCSLTLSTKREDLIKTIKESFKTLDEAGFSEIVYVDFQECVIDLIQSSRSAEDVEKGMNVVEQSNSIVVFFRFLTSAYVKVHADAYAAYLLLDDEGKQGTVSAWCERWIEAMGAEADNLQINALVNALHVNVHVHHLDGTDTQDGRVNVSHVVPDSGTSSVTVKVLYRPGHYDVLI